MMAPTNAVNDVKCDVAADLEKAAQFLDKHKLARGVRVDGKGGYCALGVIDHCGMAFECRPHAIKALMEHLLPVTPLTTVDDYNSREPIIVRMSRNVGDDAHWNNGTIIAAWNNKIAKDKAEVVNAFRDAAAAIRTKQVEA